MNKKNHKITQFSCIFTKKNPENRQRDEVINFFFKNIFFGYHFDILNTWLSPKIIITKKFAYICVLCYFCLKMKFFGKKASFLRKKATISKLREILQNDLNVIKTIGTVRWKAQEMYFWMKKKYMTFGLFKPKICMHM